MIGFIVRAVLGLVGVGLAGAAIYFIVKEINISSVKRKLQETILNTKEFKDVAFKAKIKKKAKKSISLDVLTSWDSVIVEDIEIKGESISDDINVGTVIMIRD